MEKTETEKNSSSCRAWLRFPPALLLLFSGIGVVLSGTVYFLPAIWCSYFNCSEGAPILGLLLAPVLVLALIYNSTLILVCLINRAFLPALISMLFGLLPALYPVLPILVDVKKNIDAQHSYNEQRKLEATKLIEECTPLIAFLRKYYREEVSNLFNETKSPAAYFKGTFSSGFQTVRRTYWDLKRFASYCREQSECSALGYLFKDNQVRKALNTYTVWLEWKTLDWSYEGDSATLVEPRVGICRDTDCSAEIAARLDQDSLAYVCEQNLGMYEICTPES